MLLLFGSAAAQDGLTEPWLTSDALMRGDAPSVFLDCNRCDRSFIRQEISFVNYVRDRRNADVHLLVTNQRTGSGGHSYVLDFIGQKKFEGLNYRLGYVSRQTDSWSEEREGLAQIMVAGLTPYVAQTSLATGVSVSVQGGQIEEAAPLQVRDPWNSWVFDIDGTGSLDLEAARRSIDTRGSISADRVTETYRIRTSLYGNYDTRRFRSDDDWINSTSKRNGFFGSIVRSVSGYLSAGLSGHVYTSTYSNIGSSISFAPAIEYSYFPYSESLRRELTFAYRVGYRYNDYIEQTIFQKTSEALMNQSLQMRLAVQQPWGSVYTQVEGSHYFHDLSKNRVEVSSQLRLRVARGLSVRFSGGMELIHDQLNLPAGEATLEEILLRRTQLATTYEYRATIGIGYTFGSIYNNIVNTRL